MRLFVLLMPLMTDSAGVVSRLECGMLWIGLDQGILAAVTSYALLIISLRHLRMTSFAWETLGLMTWCHGRCKQTCTHRTNTKTRQASFEQFAIHCYI